MQSISPKPQSNAVDTFVRAAYAVAFTMLLGGCNGGAGQSPIAAVPATAERQIPASADAAHAASSANACGTSNIALDKIAIASSEQNGALLARAAFDGDLTTRWSSAFSDPQWVQVNLGSVRLVCGATLTWDPAYAKTFSIDISSDAAHWTTLYATQHGTGGKQTVALNGSGKYLRMTGTSRATTYGYSIDEVQVFTPESDETPTPTTGYVAANPPVTGVVPSTANPPNRNFHEFQANCSVSRTELNDDPIVYFNQPGASHSHTFLGNRTTRAGSTLATLARGTTTCKAPGDLSAYWMPTMYEGSKTIDPTGPQVIYYKTGVIDYTSVRPFPRGLRFVVGDKEALPAEFGAYSVEGWECGNSYYNQDFPNSCMSGTELNVRYQAPSCWDGLHLDAPDHRSHMAYPVAGHCTTSHPVAVPMLEFKMAFPAGTDTSTVRLSSGRGYSFHYDFYNVWDPPTLAALVKHCINGGLQCDARGYDQSDPGAGAALNGSYELP